MREFAFLAGGLALFLYGMQRTSAELKTLCGRKVKVSLALLTGNRLMGVALGIFITVMLNSSSAATVMLVGLAASGIIDLRQGICLVLGATIGTTVIVQIIAFDLTQAALIILAVGFVLTLVQSRKNLARIGGVMLGVGMIFFSMYLMKLSMQDLRGPYFEGLVKRFLSRAPLGFLTSTIFTAITQSSAATIAMTKPLLEKGLTLKAALPIVFGANVGTTVTAILASAVSNREGRRIAYVHLFVKLVGVAVFFPLIGFLAWAAAHLTSLMGSQNPARALANAHTLFNLCNVILLLPFVPLVARLFERILPKAPEAEEIIKLDKSLLESPEHALSRAAEEVSSMAEKTIAMLRKASIAFEEDNERALDEARAEDGTIDLYEDVLTDFLTRLEEKDLSDAQLTRRSRLLYALKEVEDIGDVISKQIVPQLLQKVHNQLDFTIEGALAIRTFCDRIIADFEVVAAAVIDADAQETGAVLEYEGEIDGKTKEMHLAHLRAIEGGLAEAKEVSSIFLDLIHSLRFIHFYLADIVKMLK
jgi:phosphate:Na+ symporter